MLLIGKKYCHFWENKGALSIHLLYKLFGVYFHNSGVRICSSYRSWSVHLQRKRSAVGAVKQEAQKVLGEGEHLLEEANQLSDNINKELEVLKSHMELHICVT